MTDPRPPSSNVSTTAPREPTPDVGSPRPQAPANTLRAPAPELVTDTARSLETNRHITQGYIQLAHELQALLDPNFRPGGTSRVLNNWFAFAPHASHEAGKGMLGAHLARAIIDAAQGEPAASVQHALDRGRLSGKERLVAEKVADTLRWFGLSHDVAACLGTLLSAADIEALADPRTLWISTYRFARLLHKAPGITPLDKAESVASTLEQLLLDGNVAIFTDIGGAARAYLDWRRSALGEVTSARVVEDFTLEGARSDEARRAWVYALAHVKDSPQPTDFASVLPGVDGRSLVVAAFALFEDARRAASPTDRDALIAFANNYLAWREQHDAVQPAFSPATPRASEVPRLALMLAMTPTIRLELGPQVAWELSDYTATRKDRDHNFLTSKPTEYNWALFEDRWPAILHCFALGYRHGDELWKMPQPLTQSLNLLEVG